MFRFYLVLSSRLLNIISYHWRVHLVLSVDSGSSWKCFVPRLQKSHTHTVQVDSERVVRCGPGKSHETLAQRPTFRKELAPNFQLYFFFFYDKKWTIYKNIEFILPISYYRNNQPSGMGWWRLLNRHLVTLCIDMFLWCLPFNVKTNCAIVARSFYDALGSIWFSRIQLFMPCLHVHTALQTWPTSIPRILHHFYSPLLMLNWCHLFLIYVTDFPTLYCDDISKLRTTTPARQIYARKLADQSTPLRADSLTNDSLTNDSLTDDSLANDSIAIRLLKKGLVSERLYSSPLVNKRLVNKLIVNKKLVTNPPISRVCLLNQVQTCSRSGPSATPSTGSLHHPAPRPWCRCSCYSSWSSLAHIRYT